MLSFVIISGGMRPRSVARLLDSLTKAGVGAAERLIVGRHDVRHDGRLYVPHDGRHDVRHDVPHDGPIPDGVRLIPAPDLADTAAICAMRNRGIDAAAGNPVILLDDDIEITPGWYSAIAPAIADRRFDITGCRVVTPTGRRWYDWSWASRDDPSCPPRLLEYTDRSPNAYISGCFMIVERRVFTSVRFDEQRLNHQRDDVDFCHRATDAGFTLGVIPEATVIHHLEPAGRSASDPASGSAAFADGIALLRLEQYDEALTRFQAAAATEGMRARYHVGVCLMELGRHDEAAEALAEVVDAQADSADVDRRRVHYSALYRLGVLGEYAGDIESAHRFYAAALAGFPEHQAAQQGHARTASLINAVFTGEPRPRQ